MGTALAVGSLVASGASAAAKYGAANKQAGAMQQQAGMYSDIARENAQVWKNRAGIAKQNAQHSTYLANFTRQMSGIEAALNRQLGSIQRNWGYAYAAQIEKFGQSQKKAFDLRAKSVLRFASEDTRRHVKEGQRVKGAVRSSIAASGVLETGSPLEVIAENAAMLALERADIRVQAEDKANVLRYEGKVAEYTSQVNAIATRYQADLSMYHAEVNAWSTEQQGAIQAYNFLIEAENWRGTASDYKQQAKITLMEGNAQSQGLLAESRGVKSAARASLFGDVAGLIGSAGRLGYAGAYG